MADLLSDDEVMGRPKLLSDDDVMGVSKEASAGKSKSTGRPVGAAMVLQQPRRETPTQPPIAPEDEGRAALEDPNYVPPDARAGSAPLTDQRPAAQPPEGRSWGSVAKEAIANVPSSAAHFAQNLVQPILHPIDTAKSVAGLVDAVGSKISRPGDLLREGDAEPTAEQLKARREREVPADAVADFFVDRYGSVEGFKKAVATDPVGVVADAATVLSMGGAGLARAPGLVGELGQIANRTGAAIDPLTQAGNAVKLGAKGVEAVASNALGMTTGAGPESIRAAGRAGREGGEAAEAFTENMRGKVPIENIVDLAKSGLDQIRQERADAYKAGKVDLSKDKTVLDFQPIEDALFKAHDIGTYEGKVVDRSAAATMDKITDIVGEWQGLDPKIYHTPEGLDALKRTIGDIRDSTQYGTPERVAADRVYKAVRDEVAAQAPGYSKMMADYAQASDRIKEVTKTFSLGEKATGDTAARKLQSATRDGAQTSWRKRGELLDELAEHEPTLPYAIAGQSVNALAPRGLVARGGGMVAAGSTAPGVLANPLAALPLVAFSPRIVGETVYFGGKAVGGVDKVAEAFGMTPERVRLTAMGAFQAGRAEEVDARTVANKIMGAGTIDEAIAAAQEFARRGR